MKRLRHISTTWRPAGLALAVFAALALAGCAAGERAHRQGMEQVEKGNYPEGVALMAQATREDPTNAILKKDYLLERNMIVERLLAEAGAQRRARQYDVAEQTYRRVLGVEPTNVAAQQGLYDLDAERRHDKMLREADALAKKGDTAAAKKALRVVNVESPGNQEAEQLRQKMDEPTIKERIAGPTLNIKGRKPLTMQFRDANLKMVLEAIARTTGVNILVDKEVRSDIKVTLFVKDTPVEAALDLLLIQNQLEKRVLGENTVLIYPATTVKNKDYQELKIRRFALASADPKQVQSMIKSILKTRDIFVDEKTRSLIIRDTPDAIRIAEQLVTAMDQPEPEVMLEIDVMQVDRNRLMQLGIDWAKSLTWSLPNGKILRELKNSSTTLTAAPDMAVTLNASKTDGDVNDLATPRIRVRNKEKAKILIGTRKPVVSSAASTTSGSTQPVYNTSIQYIETGIKLEVEPDIHPDGDVAIKLVLEVSSAGEPIKLEGNSGTYVFPINTNNVNTLLQLHDGETQILGGLIQHQNDQSQTKIPGLGDVPIIGRLFGSQTDTWNKKELVMAITPHIVRNSTIQDAERVELWSGTANRLNFGPPALQASGGNGVMGQAGGGSSGTTPFPGAMGGPPTRALPVLTVPARPVMPVVPAPPPPAPAASGETDSGDSDASGASGDPPDAPPPTDEAAPADTPGRPADVTTQ